MKTALCTIAFKELEVVRVLDLARDHGLDAVEIWGKEPHMGDTYDHARVLRLYDAIADRGLVVSAFGSYLSPLDEGLKEELEDAIVTALGLGTRVIRVWAGGGASKDVDPDVYALAVSGLRCMCLRADDDDLILALEFHDNSIADNARSILRLIGDVDCQNLGTYYQPSRREGADDPYEAAEMVGPHVVNVHAQNWDPATGGRAPVGAGAVDYGRVVDILKRHGFDGCLEIEFVDEADKLASLVADAASLRQLAAE